MCAMLTMDVPERNMEPEEVYLAGYGHFCGECAFCKPIEDAYRPIFACTFDYDMADGDLGYVEPKWECFDCDHFEEREEE